MSEGESEKEQKEQKESGCRGMHGVVIERGGIVENRIVERES